MRPGPPALAIKDVFIFDTYVQWIGENSNWNFVPPQNATESIRHYLEPIGKSITIEFTFRFERRSFYFVLNMFGPIILLTILQFTTFFIPPDAIERTSYAATIMLALFFIDDQILSYLPMSPNPVIVSIYLTAVMAFGTITTVYSALFAHSINSFGGLHKKIPGTNCKLYIVCDRIVFCILLSLVLAANMLCWYAVNTDDL